MASLMNTVQKRACFLRNFGNVNSLLSTVSGLTCTIRYRTKWVVRTPTAIANEDELRMAEETYEDEKQFKIVNNRRPRKVSKKSKNSDDERSVSHEKDPKHNIIIPQSNFLSTLMTKACKKENNITVLESVNLIRDGIKAGVKLQALVFSRKSSKILDTLTLPGDVKLYQIPYRQIKMWSTVATSPGILGVFERFDLSKIKPAIDALPLTVICDNIRDPRNLGMIIRTVAAVGCERLVLLKGCVDVWNINVQRCSASAQFRVPIEAGLTWKNVSELINENANIYIAESNTRITFDELKPERKRSPSEIDVSDTSESEESTDESETQDKLNAFTDSDELNKEYFACADSEGSKITKVQTMHSNQQKRAFKRFLSQLPLQLYYQPNYTQNHNVLVIGGETAGYSLELQHFLSDRKGTRLHIPVCNDVDSLSSSMSLGILMYEMRRQHSL